MMASATKGLPVLPSGSMHEFQQPSRILATMSRFVPISPDSIVFMFGRRPGFLTCSRRLSKLLHDEGPRPVVL